MMKRPLPQDLPNKVYETYERCLEAQSVLYYPSEVTREDNELRVGAFRRHILEFNHTYKLLTCLTVDARRQRYGSARVCQRSQALPLAKWASLL